MVLPLRVMTFNVHHAEAMDGTVSAAAIAEVVQRERPDIVGLQEVDQCCQRTDLVDFVAEFERLTGLSALFGGNLKLPGWLSDTDGWYGNLILSRFGIISGENLPIPHVEIADPKPGGDEPRGLLVARVQLPEDIAGSGGRELVFATTHIDWTSAEQRQHSLHHILAQLREHAPAPVILCGDLNAQPSGQELRALHRELTDVWPACHDDADPGFTIPSDAPRARIDYIWTTTAPATEGGILVALQPRRAWVPETLASDHLPVVAEIAVQPLGSGGSSTSSRM